MEVTGTVGNRSSRVPLLIGEVPGLSPVLAAPLCVPALRKSDCVQNWVLRKVDVVGQ